MAVIDSLKLNDGTILYPKTLTSAIYNDGGTERLDNILAKSIYATDEIPTTPLPRDADTLGGIDASMYAKASNSIVESGSNANGAYMKFGDGTMICHGTKTLNTAIATAWGSLFINDSDIMTFYPAMFIGIPSVTSLVKSIGDHAFTMNSNISDDRFVCRIARGVTLTNTNFGLCWHAIGRWK